MFTRTVALIVVYLAAHTVAQNNVETEVLHQWRLVDYVFPNESMRAELLNNGEYIPEHNMPLGMEISTDKLFITVPRWKPGVFSTLNYIPLDDTSQSPLLRPYPSWEDNRIDTPDGLVSIFRVRMDACNRLWGLDTGTDDAAGNGTVIKPNTLIAIDVLTDQIVLRYQLKPTDLEDNSFIANLVVESDPNACDDTYVYLADFSSYGMIVYSQAKNDSWRIKHNFFSFNPLEGNYNVSGHNFQWQDGLFGLALSNRNPDGYRTLYFHSMSGTQEFSVSTEVLKNKTQSVHPDYYAFHYLGNKGPKTNGPTIALDLITDLAFFPLLLKNAIGCWDTHVPLNPENFHVVWQNNVLLDYTNDIILSGNKLCAFADRLPILLFSEYNPNEYNFYISCASLEDLSASCLSDISNGGSSDSDYSQSEE